jgi:hypothetical protein
LCCRGVAQHIAERGELARQFRQLLASELPRLLDLRKRLDKRIGIFDTERFQLDADDC